MSWNKATEKELRKKLARHGVDPTIAPYFKPFNYVCHNYTPSSLTDDIVAWVVDTIKKAELSAQPSRHSTEPT
jgi:SOS response regulatory protein OraA/RecX